MGNYLQMSTQQQIKALLDLGWTHRRIARELGVHRETVGRYAREPVPKPANLITGSEEPSAEVAPVQNPPNPITGPQSLAAPYQESIQAGVDHGLSAQRIWQDLMSSRATRTAISRCSATCAD